MPARVQVYKARWHGTLVAVKVLKSEDPSEAEAFLHEISILEGLHHLHVRFYGSARSAASHQHCHPSQPVSVPCQDDLIDGVATAGP